MKDHNCIFISAFKKIIKDKNGNVQEMYNIAFAGVDAYKGEQLQAFTASCSEDDYDLVKKLPFGAAPLHLIYNQNKGYTKVEAVLSVPDPEQYETKPKK